jgi:hypothetical protein
VILPELEAALARTNSFEFQRAGETLRVTRRRNLPSRGLFRLLIPRVVVSIELRAGQPELSPRPDGWAWFMVVMCVGGLVTELTMDRARYPREYPPAFIYGLTAFIVLNLVIEVMRSRSAVQRALGAASR